MGRAIARWTSEQEAAFQFSLRLRRSIDRMMENANTVRENRGFESKFQVVAGLHMTHAYVLHAGIHTLCRSGRAKAAPPALRALLETFAGLTYIAKEDSERKAMRFVEFNAVRRLRYFETLSGLPDWQTDPLRRRGLADVESEIRGDCADYCAKYCKKGAKPPLHWHGMQVRTLFAEAGLEGAYGTAYQPLCDAVHANVTALSAHVLPVAGDPTGDLMMTRGRTDTGARDTLGHACLFLLSVAENWVKALELGDANLTRLHRRVDEWYNVFEVPRPRDGAQPTRMRPSC